MRTWFGELFYSLEEATPAQVTREKEYMFFFHLSDTSVLDSLTTKSKQEQWQILIPKSEENLRGGIVRVRKEVTDMGVTYTQTHKLWDSEPGKDEIELEIPQEVFEAHRMLCARGQVKTRYTIPIDGTLGLGPKGAGLCWEVDVFRDLQGEIIPWVKVDLEVKEALDTIPKFPLEHTHAILHQRGERTESEEAQVRKLLDELYVTHHQESNHVPNDSDSSTENTSA